MTYKSVEGVWNPDGSLSVADAELPDHPVNVIITILECDEEASLSEPGDYLDTLADYEDRLARGEIRWQ